MRGWYLVLALSACYQRASETACAISCPDGVCPSGMECGGNGLCHATGTSQCAGGPADATTDTPGDVVGGRDGGPYCFGSGIVTVCTPTLPTNDLTLPLEMQTTDSGGSPNACAVGLSITGTPSACVILARNLIVGDTFTVSGTRPLVLVASNLLFVYGTIDASSSNLVARAGPAAPAGCSAPNQTPGPTGALVGNGGGAGGTFGGQGGPGGSSNILGGGTAPAPATSFPTVVGGCPGGRGGTSNAATGGAGGPGGGAVYLIAGVRLQISGKIVANGAAGLGGALQAGGGGGGAGGYIGLDAPSYDVQSSAVLAAIGGGGGAGGGVAAGNTGTTGAESTTTADTAQNAGTNGGGNGGAGTGENGGAGGSGSAPVDVFGGGGGGGGGGGVIAVANIGMFSPVGTMIRPVVRPMP